MFDIPYILDSRLRGNDSMPSLSIFSQYHSMPLSYGESQVLITAPSETGLDTLRASS